MEKILDVIGQMARTELGFTADDVRNLLPHHRPSQMGPAFNAAQRQGTVLKVGWVPSKNPSSHGSVVAMWRGK